VSEQEISMLKLFFSSSDSSGPLFRFYPHVLLPRDWSSIIFAEGLFKFEEWVFSDWGFWEFSDKNFFNSSLNKFRKLGVNTNGTMELSVLSKIINIPIIVYDNYYNIKYIFNNGETIFKPENFEKFISNKNNIFIKFDFDGSTTIPNRISSIYFL